MSNIDKQALRQTAEKAQEHGVFNMDIHSETVLALLDELEAAEKRIAELELLTSPQLPQPAVVSDEMINTFEAEFRRAFKVSDGVEQLIEIDYQGEKFSLSIRDAATWWKLGRAAMLKHSEPFIVTSDHRMMEMHQVEAINAVTAMIQGVENAETPTTMQTAPARDSSPKIAESTRGNSPVIQDGWVMVPEEPTHEMLEAGDEQFGTYDVYRRMIAAAPQQEVK